MSKFATFTPPDSDAGATQVAGQVEVLRELDRDEVMGSVRMFEVRSVLTGATTHAFIDELKWEE